MTSMLNHTTGTNMIQQHITTYEGSKIDVITSQFGLQQLIHEPTHTLTDSLSCIDLILTSQSDLVMQSVSIPLFIKIVIISICKN